MKHIERTYREDFRFDDVRWLRSTGVTDTIPGRWYISRTNYRDSEQISDYKRKIRQGSSATTGLSGRRYTWDIQGGSTDFRLYEMIGSPPVRTLVQRDRTLGVVPQLEPGFSDGSLPMNSISADNQAIRQFTRALRQSRTSVQGLVFLGELREAVRMFRNPVRSLNDGFNSYFGAVAKRVKGAKKPSRRRIIAETWLEYSFGWKPFVSDLEDAFKAYHNVFHRKLPTTRITRQGTERVSEPQVMGSMSLGINTAGKYTDREETSVTVRYIAGLKTSLQAVTPQDKFREFGISLEQIGPALWELTPWSFLVDYFTNIGDIVDSAFTISTDVLWVNKTIRRVCTRTRTIAFDKFETERWYPAWSVESEGSSGTGKCVTTSIERSASGVPTPTLELSVPGNPSQWVNMAALAITRQRLISVLKS